MLNGSTQTILEWVLPIVLVVCFLMIACSLGIWFHVWKLSRQAAPVYQAPDQLKQPQVVTVQREAVNEASRVSTAQSDYYSSYVKEMASRGVPPEFFVSVEEGLRPSAKVKAEPRPAKPSDLPGAQPSYFSPAHTQRPSTSPSMPRRESSTRSPPDDMKVPPPRPHTSAGGSRWLGDNTQGARVIEDAIAFVATDLEQMRSTTTIDERRKRYYQLLRQWHPDKNPLDPAGSTAVFQFLQEKKPWVLCATSTNAPITTTVVGDVSRRRGGEKVDGGMRPSTAPVPQGSSSGSGKRSYNYR